MVKNHLSRLLGERRMRQSELSKLTKIRANTISDLYNEVATSISFDNLEAICNILECTITDLLEIHKSEPRSKY